MFPTTLLVSRRGAPVGIVRGEVDWNGADGKRLIESLAGGVMNNAQPPHVVSVVKDVKA